MHIGKIKLSSPFCQAGLAGYSDRAMRVVARRRGCPYAVTESLLDVIMLSGGQGLKKSIDINDEDHPVAGQIIGSDPDTMARAARILHDAGYDVIDLNFACPVKKIKNKARGGHMMQDTPRGISILKAVRDALPPEAITTISLRRGFDETPKSVERFYEIVESAWDYGYSAIRVHGRTVEQKYQGRSLWPFIAEVKARYPDRTILGSGDVFTAEDAVRMLQETAVDIVWIARGAIGNPWIFQQAAALLERLRGSGFGVQEAGENDQGAGSLLQSKIENRKSKIQNPPQLQIANCKSQIPPPPTIHAQRDALTEHFALAMEIHGEQLAGRRMRKMGIKYARFHPMAKQVKAAFIEVSSLRQWQHVLDQWYAADGEGVWPDPKSADEVNDGGNCEAA